MDGHRESAEQPGISADGSAEAALRESQRRLATLMSNLPGMAYRCLNDANWTMQFVSEGCLQLTGYSAADLVGNRAVSYSSIIHPDDQKTVWSRVQAGVSGRSHFQMKYRIRTATGQEKWVWEQGIGVYSQSGELEALEGFITDITEQRRAQDALRQAHDELHQRVEERTTELATSNWQLTQEIEVRRQAEKDIVLFRRFAEATRQGFGMIDLSGRIQYANGAMARLTEEDSPESFHGKQVYEYFPQETRDAVDECIRVTLRDGQWSGEMPMLTRRGRHIQTLHHALLIRDEQGNPFRLATVVTDITERKQAEEALRQSHEELSAIYEGMIEGVVIIDFQTKRVVRGNNSMCRMLGYSEAELLSKSVSDIHPADELPKVLASRFVSMEGQTALSENRRVLRKDGSVFYADIVGRAIVYNGRPCIIGVFRDVTERRQVQEALQRERRTLERLLRSSDRERQLIAYEIHDGLAQQLVGSIMQFQLYDHLKDEEPQEASQAYDVAMKLLRQSHLEARRLIGGLRPPILDESGVVAAISALVNEQRSQGGPSVEFRSRVEFDRLAATLENAIYRIVQEGLANAFKHSNSKKARVQLTQHGDQVQIEICDWGVGFDPESVKENCYGLEGIRERARLLGGQVRIESEPGQGTRIIVDLPVVPAERVE